MKYVLATGGAGYLGSSFVTHLLTRGYDVVVLDRFVSGVIPFSSHPRLRVFRGDVRDRETLRAVMNGVEAVVHFAFVSNDPEYKLKPEIAASVNLEGTRSTLEEAKSSGVGRFILMSSCSVYGSREGVVTERDIPSPLTDYARHKIQCEEMVLAETEHEMARIVLRPATVTGPSPQMRFDLLLNRMAAQAATTGIVDVPNRSSNRPVTAMSYLLNALLLLLEAEPSAVRGQRFNLASSERRIDEWSVWVAQLLGAEPKPRPGAASADTRSYQVSCDAIRECLGLRTQNDLEQQVLSVGRIARELQPKDILLHPHHNRLQGQIAHCFDAPLIFERCL